MKHAGILLLSFLALFACQTVGNEKEQAGTIDVKVIYPKNRIAWQANG
jgi:hypothetical protein